MGEGLAIKTRTLNNGGSNTGAMCVALILLLHNYYIKLMPKYANILSVFIFIIDFIRRLL